jgi:Cof subfamily protein (haloacid dehalogenase superfamily)
MSEAMKASLMPNVEAVRMLRFARARGYHMHFFDGGRMYTPDRPACRETAFESSLTSCRLEYVGDAGVAHIGAVAKASFFAPAEVFDRDEGDIRAAFSAVHVVRSKPRYIEIMHADAGKGAALSFIAAARGVARESVMCCGDEDNDLSMFDASGLRVAMGNATENVKAKADWVTGDNGHDGVAEAVMRWL